MKDRKYTKGKIEVKRNKVDTKKGHLKSKKRSHEMKGSNFPCISSSNAYSKTEEVSGCGDLKSASSACQAGSLSSISNLMRCNNDNSNGRKHNLKRQKCLSDSTCEDSYIPYSFRKNNDKACNRMNITIDDIDATKDMEDINFEIQRNCTKICVNSSSISNSNDNSESIYNSNDNYSSTDSSSNFILKESINCIQKFTSSPVAIEKDSLNSNNIDDIDAMIFKKGIEMEDTSTIFDKSDDIIQSILCFLNAWEGISMVTLVSKGLTMKAHLLTILSFPRISKIEEFSALIHHIPRCISLQSLVMEFHFRKKMYQPQQRFQVSNQNDPNIDDTMNSFNINSDHHYMENNNINNDSIHLVQTTSTNTTNDNINGNNYHNNNTHQLQQNQNNLNLFNQNNVQISNHSSNSENSPLRCFQFHQMVANCLVLLGHSLRSRRKWDKLNKIQITFCDCCKQDVMQYMIQNNQDSYLYHILGIGLGLGLGIGLGHSSDIYESALDLFASALQDGCCPKLDTLYLAGLPRVGEKLFKAMRSENGLLHLRKLILECRLEDSHAIMLSKSIKTGSCKNLLNLELSNNFIREDGTRNLMDAILEGECKNLRVLTFGNNMIGKAGNALARVMRAGCFSNLIELYLYNNDLRSSAIDIIKAIGEGNCPSLYVLRLDHNDIKDEGAIALAEALKSSTSKLVLQELGIYKNGIGPIGATALAASLSNLENTLYEFDIFDNPIENEGAIALANMFINHNWSQLETLRLHTNEIKFAGARKISEMLLSNSCGNLRLLHLGGNFFGKKGIKVIRIASMVRASQQITAPLDLRLGF